jgi:hypothetical protein
MKKTILALALVAGLASFVGSAKATPTFVYQPSAGFSGGGGFDIANVNNNSGGAFNSIYIDLQASYSQDSSYWDPVNDELVFDTVTYPSSVSFSGNNYTSGPLGNQGITSVFLASANFGDLVNGSTSFAPFIFNLSNGNNQYAAIKLNTGINNSSSFDYGWMSFNVSGAGIADGYTTPTFTLTAYGYDTTGASVTVGQTTAAVPEPSTYALFGIGAIGLLMVLRRKVA